MIVLLRKGREGREAYQEGGFGGSTSRVSARARRGPPGTSTSRWLEEPRHLRSKECFACNGRSTARRSVAAVRAPPGRARPRPAARRCSPSTSTRSGRAYGGGAPARRRRPPAQKAPARDGHALRQLVRGDLGHETVDVALHVAAARRLALGVVAAGAAVRAPLHEHGEAQPRPVHDGVRGRAVQTYSVSGAVMSDLSCTMHPRSA